MKALSIRQPWAWLIAEGYKNIENRSWATNFRGRIYIHAGKRFDDNALFWLREKGLGPIERLTLHSRELPREGIIGEVDIVDCVTSSTSLWFVGPYGFVLTNPVRYESSIPCKGGSGFFEPKFENTNVERN
jgi:hypothetical protein